MYPNSCLTHDATCSQSPKTDVDCVISDSIQVEVELENNKKCKVYNKIEKCDKLFVLKLESLWKHVDQRKETTTIPSAIVVGEHYFLKTKKHV